MPPNRRWFYMCCLNSILIGLVVCSSRSLRTDGGSCCCEIIFHPLGEVRLSSRRRQRIFAEHKVHQSRAGLSCLNDTWVMSSSDTIPYGAVCHSDVESLLWEPWTGNIRYMTRNCMSELAQVQSEECINLALFMSIMGHSVVHPMLKHGPYQGRPTKGGASC